MRTQFICLALVIVLLCPCATAQWVQTNGPYGGCAMALAVSGVHIFVGIRGVGVYHSTNNGTDWTPVSSGLTNMYMWSLLFDGTNLFAGTEEGGVFLSTDYGAHWTAVNTGLTDPYAYALAVSGTNLFAGTNGGVFLSTNNGTSWTAVNAGLTNPHVYALAVSGTNVFAGTLGGVFVSTNNGTSWIAVNSGLTDLSVRALMVVGTNLFAGTTGGGIFRSTNNGSDWTAVNSVLMPGVLTLGNDTTTLFAGTSGGGLFRSTDNGANWVLGGLDGHSVLAVAITGRYLFAGTAGGIYRSFDNGTSWSEADSTIVNSCIVALTSKGTDLFASADANGVVRSTDNGNSWTPVNSGKSDYGATSLAVSGVNLFAGVFQHGVYKSTNNGESWTSVNKGLTDLEVLALLVSETYLFAGTTDGVFRSTNNGTDWTSAKTGLPNGCICPLATNGTYIFAGSSGDGVFRSTDNGASWTAANSGISDVGVQAFGVSGASLFVGTSDGLFRSTDNGTTWSAANTGLTDTYVLAFAVSGGNVFVGNEFNVALSTDNGTTWVPVDAGLALAPPWVNSLAISGAYLFAGTGHGGVWRRPLSEMIPTGSLAVTVHNAENWGGPGTEGRVTLFSPGGFVAQQSTDTLGVTAFSSVPAGTGFSYTVNLVRPENAAIPHLYWGKKSGVSIAEAATTTESFTRNAPYNLEWHIYDTTTNQSVYTTTIGRGTGLRAEVIVRNPSYSGALARTVRSSMIIDRDKVPPYDLVISSSNALLGVGATRTDKMYFTLNTNGSYFVTSVEYADSDGHEVETDGEPWSTTPFLTVTDPAFPLHVAPPHMIAGLDTPVTVMWTRPAGASSFHLQVGRDSTFTSGLILHDFPTVDTFAVLHSLSFLTSYWWHVNAYNPATGITAFSHPWQFSTGLSLPGTITLVDPSQNAVVNADTLLLRWKSTKPLVDRYWLEYGVDSVFTLKATDSLLLDTTAVIRNMFKGLEYYWRVRAHNLAGWGPYSSTGRFLRSLTAVNTMPQGIPSDWVLMQNFPNPFNPSTTITFGLPQRAQVLVTVYNTLGETMSELVNGEQEAGYHEVKFDGGGLSSGVYFYRIQAGSFVETKKLLMIR